MLRITTFSDLKFTIFNIPILIKTVECERILVGTRRAVKFCANLDGIPYIFISWKLVSLPVIQGTTMEKKNCATRRPSVASRRCQVSEGQDSLTFVAVSSG